MKNLKKILVLGSTGMLGHQVVSYFSNFIDYRIYDISYRTKLRPSSIILDVIDSSLIEKNITEINPDFIINCIGCLNMSPPIYENSIYLNAYLPHLLKNISKKLGSKLIHISTDCVFSGIKGQYLELDKRDGNELYSQTKKLGEIVDKSNVTLRTSIIGPELKVNGQGLFHWFMCQNENIEGYTESIWSGVTTFELAKAIHWAIDNKITGLYHITNGHSINKYELLELFKKHTHKDIKILSVKGKKSDKSLVDSRKLINYEIPLYEKMVFDMVACTKLNNNLYGYSGI